MSEWQDISTAPKDGTKIDVWCVNDVFGEPIGRVPDAWWSEEHEEWSAGASWLSRPIEAPVATATGRPVVKVTHWMPKPQPPTLGGK